MTNEFKKGDRVRLSARGIEALLNPKKSWRTGTVIRISGDGTVVLFWDGNKPQSQVFYSPDFLEVVDEVSDRRGGEEIA